MIPFQEGMGERSHKKHNQFLPVSLQFRKNYPQCQICHVAVGFSDTPLEQFFPLVQPVKCEISLIWIAVLHNAFA